MKYQILDDLFQDSLREELEPNEKVIWEGAPRMPQRAILWRVLYWSATIAACFYFFYNKEYMWVLYVVGFSLFGFWSAMRKRIKTKYLLSSHRIIFQLPEKGKKKIYSLPLSRVSDLKLKKKGKDNGVIFLKLKKPFKTKLRTYDLTNNGRRNDLTLELIDDVEEVAEYIRDGIRNNEEL